ncbi:MAG: hypothetical protein EOO15_15345 [Chitinophagaceae bacterium]|nr:MAG: hypothetical protein EOO15_15345 [Chitinophagaceae bacterium]
MFVVFWIGWGLAVLPLALIGGVSGVLAGRAISEAAHFSTTQSGYVSGCLAGLLGGLLIYGFQRWRAEASAEMVYDEVTDRRFKLLGEPGSFMFVPMRYWAGLFLAGGLIAGVSAFFV